MRRVNSRSKEVEEKWRRKIQGASRRRRRRESVAINREGVGRGVFYSQVFLPFEGGIPPLPLRKKIINTFAVAMPTRGLSLCSQLWAFLAIITHSSRALHNYPQSIRTSIWEREWGIRNRKTPAFICILCLIRHCIALKGRVYSTEGVAESRCEPLHDICFNDTYLLLYSFSLFPSHYSCLAPIQNYIQFLAFFKHLTKITRYWGWVSSCGTLLGSLIMPCCVLGNLKQDQPYLTAIYEDKGSSGWCLLCCCIQQEAKMETQ